MTAAEDSLKAAKAALAKIARGKKTTADGQHEFADALVRMAEAGVSVAQMHRDTGVSETHIRNTIKMETLRRGTRGEQAG